MKESKNESKPKINRNCDRLPVPGVYKRLVRARRNRDFKRRNDGQKKGHGLFNIMGLTMWNGQAIFFPKRKKFKGWQRENRRRKAA